MDLKAADDEKAAHNGSFRFDRLGSVDVIRPDCASTSLADLVRVGVMHAVLCRVDFGERQPYIYMCKHLRSFTNLNLSFRDFVDGRQSTHLFLPRRQREQYLSDCGSGTFQAVRVTIRRPRLVYLCGFMPARRKWTSWNCLFFFSVCNSGPAS